MLLPIEHDESSRLAVFGLCVRARVRSVWRVGVHGISINNATEGKPLSMGISGTHDLLW